MVLRIVFYIVGFIFGFDVLLLPGVLNDDIGIFKSISPIIGYQVRDDNDETFWFRIITAVTCVMFVIVSLLFWQYTSLMVDFFYSIYEMTRDWGFNKMEEMHSGGNQVSIKSRYEEHMRSIGDI